jgi:hypothetical protein
MEMETRHGLHILPPRSCSTLRPPTSLDVGLLDILSTSDTRLFGWMDEQSLPDFSSSPPNSPWSLYHANDGKLDSLFFLFLLCLFFLFY